MLSAYLRLLIFLLAILIPACASNSLAFPIMHSAYKLNKQGDSIQPWHTSFSIWNQSVIPCPVLDFASWPAYRFLRRYSHIFKNFPVCCDPQSQTSQVAQLVKNLPAMQKTWVQSLGQEYPLEKGMSIHSSILAWKILWAEESGGL